MRLIIGKYGIPHFFVQMGTIQNSGSDLFTTYGLDSVSSNLDISNEVGKIYYAQVTSLNSYKALCVHT